jgi:hypothetical protein
VSFGLTESLSTEAMLTTFAGVLTVGDARQRLGQKSNDLTFRFITLVQPPSGNSSKVDPQGLMCRGLLKVISRAPKRPAVRPGISTRLARLLRDGN